MSNCDSPREPSPNELLELDLDIHLGPLVSDVLQHEWWKATEVLWIARFAWSRGYLTAIEEPRRGEFLRAHGLRIPPKKRR
jgi:hypothetical protein